VGIPTTELSRIWERLYRVDASRSRSGQGLGLSFVQAVVEAHDGHIDVESEPTQGSVFSVWFPEAPGQGP
jgi:signal transduction histidine kinase